MLILSFGLIKKFFDKNRFESIHSEYFQQLFYYALRNTGDEQTANEAVTDAFMIFKEKWNDLDNYNKTALKCFLYRALKNNINNLNRKKFRNATVALDTTLKISSPDHSSGVELKKDIYRSMDKLKDEIREVVKLRLFGDLPFSEIAQILEIPTGTARRKYHEGLIRMRVELESYI